MEYRQHPSGSVSPKPRYLRANARPDLSEPGKAEVWVFGTSITVREADAFPIMRWLADCEYQIQKPGLASPDRSTDHKGIVIEIATPGAEETILMNDSVLVPKGVQFNDLDDPFEELLWTMKEQAGDEILAKALRAVFDA